MASAGEDGAVRVWPFKSDMRPLKFDWHKGAATCVTFNDDGNFVASGGNDGKVAITKNNAKNDKKEHVIFTAHAAPVKSVNFSRDGNRLLTSGDDKAIKLWGVNYTVGPDKLRRAAHQSFIRSFTGHTDWVLESRFSPDNRLIASVCTKSVRLWDINTGAEIINFRNANLQNTSVSFHPDGNYIAVGSGSRHLKIWDMRSQKLAQDYLMPAESNSVDFHPSGVILASGNNYSSRLNNSSLSLFDIRQSRGIFEIEGIKDSINSVSFSQDGEYFTAGGKNKLVYVWKSNFVVKKPQAAFEEELITKADNEIDIGGAISMEKQLAAFADREKNEVYEQISTNLENIVLKINNISENLWGLDNRLKDTEKKTDHLFKIIETKEKVRVGQSKPVVSESYHTNFAVSTSIPKPVPKDPELAYISQVSANSYIPFVYTDEKERTEGSEGRVPVVNNDSDNPFRGRQMLDSVNTRNSDPLVSGSRPGLMQDTHREPELSDDDEEEEEDDENKVSLVQRHDQINFEMPVTSSRIQQLSARDSNGSNSGSAVDIVQKNEEIEFYNAGLASSFKPDTSKTPGSDRRSLGGLDGTLEPEEVTQIRQDFVETNFGQESAIDQSQTQNFLQNTEGEISAIDRLGATQSNIQDETVPTEERAVLDSEPQQTEEQVPTLGLAGENEDEDEASAEAL